MANGTAGGGAAAGAAQLHSDRCSTPALLQFEAGTATVTADTSLATDEYPNVKCDSFQVAPNGFDAPQYYYSLPVQSGQQLHVKLEPSFYGFVYLFSATTPCSEKNIDLACASKGASGDVSPIVNPGASATFDFTPQFSGTAILVVDSDTSGGTFKLSVSYAPI